LQTTGRADRDESAKKRCDDSLAERSHDADCEEFWDCARQHVILARTRGFRAGDFADLTVLLYAVGNFYRCWSELRFLFDAGRVLDPNIQVVAFEPLLPIYEGLKRNIALNQLDGRVVCENMALSNQTTRATLYVPEAEGKDYEATGTLAAKLASQAGSARSRGGDSAIR